MDVSGTRRWFPDLVLHDTSGTGQVVQMVLEEAEATFRKAARRLRACGQEDQARRAERFAVWARFDLDEPAVAYRLYQAAASLRGIRRPESLAGQALEQVLS